MLARRLSTVLLFGLMVGAHVSPGHAEGMNRAREAREKAYAGYRALQHDKHERALELFQQAERLFHAPTHILFIARTQVKLGQLLAAAVVYQQLLDERIPDDAAEAFHQAQDDARAELRELRTRIPLLTVMVDPPGEPSVRVTRNGEPIPIGTPVPTDPGTHRLRASGDGFSCRPHDITLLETVQERITLICEQIDLVPAGDSYPQTSAPANALVSVSPAGLTSASPVETEQRSMNVLGWSALGVGVAGSAVGLPLLFLGLDRRAQTQQKLNSCDGAFPGCDRTQQQSIADGFESSNALVVGGSIALGLGGAALATGATLLLVSASSPNDAAARLQIAPWVGVRTAGISGRF